MKAHLLDPQRDAGKDDGLPPQAKSLIQDLELETMFRAMADGDQFLCDVARRVVLTNIVDAQVIRYRQRVLADCLAEPDVIRELYDIAVRAIEAERTAFLGRSRSPELMLHRSTEVMSHFVGFLRRLRELADSRGRLFRSEALTALTAMLTSNLDEDYLRTIEEHLKQVRFRDGLLISAQLGEGNKGTGYTLREQASRSWLQRLTDRESPGYTFQLADRDESGAQALAELRRRGLDRVANVLAHAVEDVLTFFRTLRTELAFYLGCMNLHRSLDERAVRMSFPGPESLDTDRLSFRALYDLGLALTTEGTVVPNDLKADGRRLVVVTGANQGGKSTFLRSIGVAQLMMQCGMFVPAEEFRSSMSTGVFSHYRREEDAGMKSGRFDDELRRMSEIVGSLRPPALLLCNESFGSTNEGEGSEVARQVMHALVESRVRVVFVTHLYDFAHRLHQEGNPAVEFVRAERRTDGHRTFRLSEGAPRPTSYGTDLYRRIFDGPAGNDSTSTAGER